MAAQNISFTAFRGTKDGVIATKSHFDKLEDDQALVKVTHSGLCFSDFHMKTANIVLGHEGVGIVEDLGSKISYLKKGDRVGFGYLHNTCGHCNKCLSGHDVYCPQREWYGTHDFDVGSMATHTVWKAEFLFKIPDSISSVHAAPLQCAGATVYNVLSQYDKGAHERVGIIGVGGLGHLAIEFARKMGKKVVVFSGHDNKKDEAIALGAHEFYATAGKDKLDVAPLDRLIVTANTLPEWGLYVPILDYEATVHALTIAMDDYKFPALDLTIKGIRIQGSAVASRGVHTEMLEFAARHDIKPIVETFPLNKEGIEAAFEKLGSGNMRYRGVLVAE